MKIILGLAVLCALTVFNLAFASPPISLSCPCEVTQVNQTLFRADFGIVFDNETDETYPIRGLITLAEGPRKSGVIIGRSSVFEVAYSRERQDFELYFYKYWVGIRRKESHSLDWYLKLATTQSFAENLLSEEPVAIKLPEAIFGTRSRKSKISLFNGTFSGISRWAS